MSVTIQQASVLSGRSMVLAVTIALHVLAISALMTMQIDTGKVAQEVRMILTVLHEEPRPVETRPSPPQVDDLMATPVVFNVPVPVVRLPVLDNAMPAVAEDQGVSAIVVSPATGASEGEGEGEGLALVAIAPTELQFRAVRSTDDYYPTTSIQLGEQGVAIVQVCVGPSGQIQGSPTVERSSGSRRLDQAAVRWAREALRFTPATVDGVPVAACKGFRVNFTLR